MGRFLAMDYGEKKIGLSISDEQKIIAQFLEPPLLNTEKKFERLSGIIKEYGIEKIVLGLPKSLSGERTKAARTVQDFGRQLKEKYSLPVEYRDERFTTRAAKNSMREQKISHSMSRGLVDNQTAQIILQDYLNQPRKQSRE